MILIWKKLFIVSKLKKGVNKLFVFTVLMKTGAQLDLLRIGKYLKKAVDDGNVLEMFMALI